MSATATGPALAWPGERDAVGHPYRRTEVYTANTRDLLGQGISKAGGVWIVPTGKLTPAL
jgi:hypothetical protein